MKTLGEKRVRVDFNVDDRSDVHQVKTKAAESIDFIEGLRDEPVEPSKAGERHRLVSLAQTAYEEAAMWAVKALTI
jgi:hypothetical protein